MSSFGEKIKALRKEKGWSQDEFAVKIGVHGRHIGKYENGHTLPNSESLLQIAKALDVSIDYLLLNGQERESASSKIRDKILLQEFEVVDQMEEKDREIIKSLIDAFIKKKQMETILGKG